MMEKLKALGETAANIRDKLKTEQATKQALIMPFLRILGYNMDDPDEVIPEYGADKKGADKIDYAIMKDAKPVILIECKHHTEDLDKHGRQLFKYFAATTPCQKIGILTNGYTYMLFADLENTNLKDDKPFFEFDITNLRDTDLEEIKKLHKVALDMDNILSSANDLKYRRALMSVLIEEFNTPSKEFIRYLVKRVYDGPLRDSKFAEFEPLVLQSLKQVIDDIFRDRLNSVLEADKAAKKADDDKAKQDGAVEQENRISTTQEELDTYNIIKAIGCEIVSAERILCKDYTGHFAIYIDKEWGRTFCRVKIGKYSKKLTLFKADKTESTYDLEKLDDIYKHKSAILDCISSYDL